MSFQPIDDDSLLAYADGALDPDQRAEIEALLLDDPGLRAEVDALRRLQGKLRATFSAADRLPPPGPATWDRIARRAAWRGRRWLNLALGGGATALIVIAFAALLGHGSPRATVAAPTAAPRPASAPGRVALPTGLPEGVLAYVCDHQLCVLDTTTGAQRQLTSGAEQISAPAWSPDGTHILYLAQAAQGREMRRYDVATGQVSTVFAVNEDSKFQLRARANWLSSTRQIVDLEYIEPISDMRGLSRGVWMATTADGGADSGLTLGWAEPHLAPDGRSVVFVDHDAGNGTQQVVRWLLPDGTTQSIGSYKLSPASADTSYHWPTFSPDGTQVAYFARAADGTITIDVVAVAGGPPRSVWTFRAPSTNIAGLRVSGQPALDGLSWSPDGTFLAVSVGDQEGEQHLVFGANRGRANPFTLYPGIDGAQPAWTGAPAARMALLNNLDPRRPGMAAVLPTAAPATPTPSVPTTPAPTATAIPTGTLPSGRIAFTMLHGTAGAGCWSLGVYVLNAGASQPAYLAQGCTPLLSPDRKLVAYRRESHIFVMPAGGGQEINVSGPGLIDNTVLPTWSPDSRRLAFTTDWNNRSEFYLVDADGSNRTRITQGPAAWGAGRAGIDPLWSPDGRRLAFTVSEDANWDIYVVDIDGRHLTRLTNNPTRDGVIDWSPDGRRLLFWSEHDGTATDIYMMNVDGSDRTLLSSSDAGGGARWSPDGKQIAFASGRDGQIYLMNANGGQPTRLTNTAMHTINPLWSRDGQYIIFGAFSADWQKGALYAIRVDGSQLIRLTSTDMWLQWVQR